MWILVAVAAVAAGIGGARAPVSSGPGHLAEAKGAVLTYDPSVDAPSRAMIESAIASARPEAQRLIARVDGLATVRVAATDASTAGTTQLVNGRFDVVLDLGGTLHQVGARGVTRLVLHELGHVVDAVLVDPELAAKLDAEIPAGLPCPPGTPLGACAPREERFAETFAKWAMGNDLGANLYIGYAVPPPSTGFDAWAAPLVALAG
jgi:hypothetical protein